jgi:catechol 2,3-dioxygenase-like lactoylglutathione lyase family enzyme
MAPRISGLLETSLYVDDLERAVRFFAETLGLTLMRRDERLAAFDAGRSGVLLIFRRGQSLNDVRIEGGTILGHDGTGPLHMAFAIETESYEAWRRHLEVNGVAIRSEVSWPLGGRSLYFDDPEGHVLELATPGLWPNY